MRSRAMISKTDILQHAPVGAFLMQAIITQVMSQGQQGTPTLTVERVLVSNAQFRQLNALYQNAKDNVSNMFRAGVPLLVGCLKRYQL